MAEGRSCRLDSDNADDLLGRIRAHDAGVPTRRDLPGCHGKLGRVGKYPPSLLATVTVTSYWLSGLFMPGTINSASEISGWKG